MKQQSRKDLNSSFVYQASLEQLLQKVDRENNSDTGGE